MNMDIAPLLTVLLIALIGWAACRLPGPPGPGPYPRV